MLQASDAVVQIDWLALAISVAGGLALFLYGLHVLSDSLKMVAGSAMKNILARLTSNRFKGAVAGAFITSVIQSSSVTTVLVVGFVSAGLMTLTQSVGVIMGANIGTTITAQIVAFKITKASMVLVAVGGLGFVFSKKDRSKHISLIVFALGLIFFGMNVMSEGTSPLRTYDPFVAFMRQMESPIAGILAGAVFTAVVQSSSATTGIIIVLATQGLLTLEGGIALAFGANIGTCVTALLAAIGKPVEAVRAAVIHVLFNVIGVALWIAFIDELVLLAEMISTAEGGGGVPRQVANAHTIFNVANTFVLIWFAGPIAKLATKMVRDKPVVDDLVLKAKFLDDILISTPTLAIDRARLEIDRMGERVIEMIRRASDIVLTGNNLELKKLQALDEEVDALYEQITSYLGKISSQSLKSEDAADLKMYLSIANILENMGDLVETHYVATGFERNRLRQEFSETTREQMRNLIQFVIPHLESAIDAMTSGDINAAKHIRKEKATLNRQVDELRNHLANRLAVTAGERSRIFGLESEIVESTKRLFDLTRRIAKSIVDRASDAEEEE